MTTWMVRAGRGSAHVDLFQEEGVVGVDFHSELFGEAPVGLSREQLAEAMLRSNPEMGTGKLVGASGQLYRFLNELAPADTVVTYDSSRRLYLLGRILERAPWKNAADNVAVPFRRAVAWERKVPRDTLSVSTRNTLGSIMTLFQINEEAAAELQQRAIPFDSEEEALAATAPVSPPGAAPETAELALLRSDVVEKSYEFIEDRIAKLDPYELQDLVAGILRAMGYKARVSPRGADRGVDIFASPDGIGLEEPRIFVEVKHRRQTQMTAPELRAFLGGRKPGDRCLYVSTGGFSKDARYEAERATIPLHLLDLPALRQLLIDHYPNADPDTRRLLPLTPVYWPVEPGDQ